MSTLRACDAVCNKWSNVNIISNFCHLRPLYQFKTCLNLFKLERQLLISSSSNTFASLPKSAGPSANQTVASLNELANQGPDLPNFANCEFALSSTFHRGALIFQKALFWKNTDCVNGPIFLQTILIPVQTQIL